MRTRKGTIIYPFDVLVIGYCLVMIVLLAACGHFEARYYDEWLFYATMIICAGLIIRHVGVDRGTPARLLRLLYPALMFTLFYRVTGGVMLLVFDHFHDASVVNFETAIFGIEPTRYIDAHLLNVWLNEVLSFCYFSYYLMLPLFLILLVVRKDYELLKRALTAVALTFFVSYLLFVLYPVEGPRWFFLNEYVNRVEGPVFRSLVTLIIDNAAVRGGCMPSSHVGVALVILMYCFKYYRKFAWPLLPLNIGLAISTFWGRFHYVSDVVVGGMIGVASTLIVWKWYDRWIEPTPVRAVRKEFQVENVP